MKKEEIIGQISKIEKQGKEKGWKIAYSFDKEPINSSNELVKIASKNKFRGKVVPRPIKAKGTLYIEYQKGLSGLQKMAGGAGATIGGR